MCAKAKKPNVKNGQLVVALIGKHRVAGHYFELADGAKWILQPHRWINCAGYEVKIISVKGDPIDAP